MIFIKNVIFSANLNHYFGYYDLKKNPVQDYIPELRSNEVISGHFDIDPKELDIYSQYKSVFRKSPHPHSSSTTVAPYIPEPVTGKLVKKLKI